METQTMDDGRRLRLPTYPGKHYAAKPGSVQLLGLDLDILLARCLLGPVLLDPRLEGFSSCRIPPGERERADVRIGYVHLCLLIGGNDANERVAERGAGAAIEQIAFDLRPVLARDRDVAAVVEGLLQRLADLGFARNLGNPAFKLLALPAGGDFDVIGVYVCQLFQLCC